MPHPAPNTAPSALPTSILVDGFVVQRASKEDLPEIVGIYNQSVAGKQATADLTPVSCKERENWFMAHLNNASRPIYVVRLAAEATEKEGVATASLIVAWGSFSDLYARTAYHISAEMSIYLHQAFHRKGLGHALAQWMLTQATSLGIHNVVALIFAHNLPSLGLFDKLGFEQWGCMPKVCDMQGFTADVVMLGRAMSS